MITIDNESVYDEQIAPLMAKIIAICKQYKIPMLATFNFAPNGLCTTLMNQQSLYGDKDDDSLKIEAARKELFSTPGFLAMTIMSPK